jgi:hypothetical protein
LFGEIFAHSFSIHGFSDPFGNWRSRTTRIFVLDNALVFYRGGTWLSRLDLEFSSHLGLPERFFRLRASDNSATKTQVASISGTITEVPIAE